MPQITDPSIVESRAMCLAQTYYCGIQKLVFINPVGFTSAMAQEIMSHCPMPKIFVKKNSWATRTKEDHRTIPRMPTMNSILVTGLEPVTTG